MVKLFTPEYKKQCVDIVLDGKHSVCNGSRRLSQVVTDLGIKVGRFKVRRLMRKLAIKA